MNESGITKKSRRQGITLVYFQFQVCAPAPHLSRRAGDMKMSLPTIKHATMGSDNEYHQGGPRPSLGAGLALPASRCPASKRGRPSCCWSALLPTGYRTFGPPASVAVAQRRVLDGEKYEKNINHCFLIFMHIHGICRRDFIYFGYKRKCF